MDRDELARIQARYARRAEPIGLTAEELDFEHHPTTTVVPGIPVRAWIRFPSGAELVDGEAFTWSSRAVRVTWYDGPARRVTWVWASAVTRRTDPLNAQPLGERTRTHDSSNSRDNDNYTGGVAPGSGNDG